MAAYRSKRLHPFPYQNVLGLPGRVFGRHWHQKRGPKVRTDHQSWCYGVKIRWPTEEENNRLPDGYRDQPLILPHVGFWAMFTSDLSTVERGTEFPIREHCKRLCADAAPRKPVILEWGCGAGFALRDLTNDPEIKGKALVYGYGDIWDARWNDIDGVKFLFFVKEHLIEYFKRSKQRIDFIFSHGGLNNLHDKDFSEHLAGLATLMDPDSLIVSTRIVREEINQLKDFLPHDMTELGDELSGECVLLRK
jgi:hypothetical protein